MSNTYTQIHIQAIFAVKYRSGLILKEWKGELCRYITGILQNYGHKMLSINGMPDHLHIFFGMRPSQSLSDLMQDIKGNSSKWINENQFIKEKFAWQAGFGAFSYSKSQSSKVIDYVENQEKHHKRTTFLQEYEKFLQKFEIDYDEKFLFREPE
jgi:putative transposase